MKGGGKGEGVLLKSVSMTTQSATGQSAISAGICGAGGRAGGQAAGEHRISTSDTEAVAGRGFRLLVRARPLMHETALGFTFLFPKIKYDINPLSLPQKTLGCCSKNVRSR